MLIIKSLLLAVSFLTQFSILVAPIPLDAHALSLNDDALFTRSSRENGNVKPLTSLACTWSITDRSFLQNRHHINHWYLREYVVDNWSFQLAAEDSGTNEPPRAGNSKGTDLSESTWFISTMIPAVDSPTPQGSTSQGEALISRRVLGW